ncbi:MAG: hypothetical protein IJQ81_14690 [Oscillibacter sp.]|nr:hypothetical protein [Oscillibacter sp.]
MVAPATRPGEPPYEYDAKSFLAGFFAGRGIKGHGNPDLEAVAVALSASVPEDEWQYDNRSFKTGLAIGMTIHAPGQGNGGEEATT